MNRSGFLSIIILVYLIVVPLLTIGLNAYEIDMMGDRQHLHKFIANYDAIVRLSWLIASGICLVSISVGIALMLVNRPWVVGYAIVAIWTLGPISTIAMTLFSVSGDIGVDQKREMFLSAFRESVLKSIWPLITTMYFMMSLRVAVVYNLNRIFGQSQTGKAEPVNEDSSIASELISEENTLIADSAESWVPLITLSGIQDELKYRDIISKLDKQSLPFRVDKNVIVTVFVRAKDMEKAFAVVESYT